MKKNAGKYWAELLVAILAILLRAPGPGVPLLSGREARVWMFTRDGWGHLWELMLLKADMHTGSFFPYVWFMKLWSGGGDSELWLRMPSLLAGLLTILLVYALVKRVFGRPAAVIAALLLAVMPYHVMVSRAAIATSIGLLFFTLGLYLFWRVFEGENNGWVAAAFSIVMLAGVNFGFHAAFLVLPANILFFGFAKNRVRALWWWIPLNIVLLASAAFWAKHWMPAFFMPGVIDPENPLYNTIPSEQLVNLNLRLLFIGKYVHLIFVLGGVYIGERLLNGWSVIGGVLAIVIYHYLPFAGFREYEDGYRPRVFMFFVAGTSLAMALLFCFTSVGASESWQVILPAAVPFYAVAANGIVRFTGWRARAVFAVLVLCVIFGFVPAMKQSELAKPDWNSVTEYMRNSDSPLAFTDSSMSPPMYYYGRGMESRIYSMTNNFDMELIGGKRYRQDELKDILHVTIDDHPPDGLIRLFEKTGRLIVIRRGKDVPEKPRWAKEYAIWLNKFPLVLAEKEIAKDVWLQEFRFEPMLIDR